MTILDETINKLIRDIIRGVISRKFTVSFTVIRSKQNGPRPEDEYADVNLVSDTSLGWSQKNEKDEGEDILFQIRGARQLTLSIGFYRNNARDYARAARTSFELQSVCDNLKKAGLGFVRVSEVRDLSEVLESKWEERAQFDLTLSAVGSDEEIINTITSVIITGGYETTGKSIPIDVEVNT